MKRAAMGALVWLAQAASAQAPDAAAPAVRRPDERTAESPVVVNVLGRAVELGFSDEITRERRLGFDLDPARQRGRDVTEHELKLDARWRAFDGATLFVQAVGLAERRHAPRDGAIDTTERWERGQTWIELALPGSTPATLQLGRIAWIEPRSWWWDDDLDGVRLRAAPGDWQLEAGWAREALRLSPSDDAIAPAQQHAQRVLGRARWSWASRHALEGFALAATDRSDTPAPGTRFRPDAEDREDRRLRWLGLRASGETRPGAHRLRYRADAALVRGREAETAFDEADDGTLVAGATTATALRARAWDIGGQWVLPGEARPTFTLGWARGSVGFRQTGLHENKGRVAGVKRLRYYGELLRPELANLAVASVGFGLRFASNSSAEVIAHRYRQVVAAPGLRGSRLQSEPLGADPRLGHEVDLQLALREWRHVELTLRLMHFTPGAAFGADRPGRANAVELGATLSF